MLKKRKHKMKRRNTEPHMQLPLSIAGASALPEPSSAPPVTAHAQSYARAAPVRLVDLCDSPTHATPV